MMREKISNLIKSSWLRLTVREHPAPDCWAFSSVHNRTFNYNSGYLFLYVKEHCPDIHPYYIVNDPVLRKKLQEIYGKEYFIETETLEGIRKVLSCKVWITSTAPPLYGTGFRKKYRIINLWHGIPLKKIGMEQANLSVLTRICYKAMFADNYTAVVTTSEHLIPVMSKSFLVEPERIKVWGQPRNDMLFEKKDGRAIFRKLLGEAEEGQRYILYAPTFRDHEPTRLFPFPECHADGRTGIPDAKSLEELQEWLKKRKITLCVRLHLYDQTNQAWLTNMDVPGSHIRLLGADRAGDIMEILNLFDLLITDYSSIYMDYLLTGKPMIFLPYDKEKYLQERGMNFPYDQVTPGPQPKTLQEFLNSMENLLYNHDSYVVRREETKNYFNEIQEPCCQTICEQIQRIAFADTRGK